MARILQLEEKLAEIAGASTTPRLLLHCCCAPCASYVLEYLSPYFLITTLYFNPNIRPREEYDKRAGELSRLLLLTDYPNPVASLDAPYSAEMYDAAASAFWDEPEGGMRCRACIGLRLGQTAEYAKSGGFDYFATTLTVSPHKDAAYINETGSMLSEERGAAYLQSDFKKKDGYKRSVELSKLYGLYRQSYCGCLAERRA